MQDEKGIISHYVYLIPVIGTTLILTSLSCTNSKNICLTEVEVSRILTLYSSVGIDGPIPLIYYLELKIICIAFLRH